jgi:hypothetical protein
MLTAFYVDNGPHLPLWDHLPAPAFWLLPSLIEAPPMHHLTIVESSVASGPRWQRSAWPLSEP